MTIEIDPYQANLEEQRAQRAAGLLADRSWLTLAGLFWLQPGENVFGTAAEHPIVLPGNALPAKAGLLIFDGETVTVEAAPGATLTINGVPVTRQPLAHDMTAAPDYLELGELTMLLIRRGGRWGIRLWDRSNPNRLHFPGLRWYPVDPTYRLTATFVAYTPPQPLHYTNVLGDRIESTSPGQVCFTWQGEEYALVAEDRGDQLFFNFRDATNGRETYTSGRFLYTSKPQDGLLTLDFNQATNPYCAYTDYATCPLPPAQNHLPFAVTAGEMNFPRFQQSEHRHNGAGD